MVAPVGTFSVGVDADPMMVEQAIGKSLDEIIKERRKDLKGKRPNDTGSSPAHELPNTLYHSLKRSS